MPYFRYFSMPKKTPAQNTIESRMNFLSFTTLKKTLFCFFFFLTSADMGLVRLANTSAVGQVAAVIGRHWTHSLAGIIHTRWRQSLAVIGHIHWQALECSAHPKAGSRVQHAL